MRDTILIAPDKFKGTLTAEEVAQIIADELRPLTSMRLLLQPMADGGEGTPATLNERNVIVSNDFIGPQCFSNVPIIHRSSFPLGESIKKRITTEEEFYVGVGGTATADGGAGALQALGARFYDTSGSPIQENITPEDLLSVRRIAIEKVAGLLKHRCTLLCDVRASLTGPGLSSIDFLRQKGATRQDSEIIRSALVHFKNLLKECVGSPFDGAGGGLPFALAGVCEAGVAGGAETILATKPIDWNRVALVITGEGRYDSQTAGGKVVETVCAEALRRGLPPTIVAGHITPEMRMAALPTVKLISSMDEGQEFEPEKANERLRLALRRELPDLLLTRSVDLLT